jgi:hypothetical protein
MRKLDALYALHHFQKGNIITVIGAECQCMSCKQEHYDVDIGLKQGCLISPILFNLYINDLAVELKDAECGIAAGGEMLSVLLYADDLVLLSSTEQGLQQQLDVLHSWCERWKLTVNVEKSKVMHFRRGPSVYVYRQHSSTSSMVSWI